MSNAERATHNHKRAGAVVVLQSTGELAQIRVPASGEEFWVMRKDLTELLDGVVAESKPSKKESRANRVSAPPTRTRRAA